MCTSNEKVAKFVKTPICCLLFQSFIFFFVKTCNLIFIWKGKKVIFLFLKRPFLKDRRSEKIATSRRNIFGATEKKERKNQNHFHYMITKPIHSTFDLCICITCNNVYFFIAWFFLIIIKIRTNDITTLAIMTSCFIRSILYLNMILLSTKL